MNDLDAYKITDVYTGRVVRHKTPSDLTEFLLKAYATLTDGQRGMIRCLEDSFKQQDADGIKWYGAACGLNIEPRKKTRRKAK